MLLVRVPLALLFIGQSVVVALHFAFHFPCLSISTSAPRRTCGRADLAAPAKWGESPAAILVLRPGNTVAPGEVIAYCRARLAAYKVPGVVEFAEEIPRTSTGKIEKQLLCQRFPGPAPQ